MQENNTDSTPAVILDSQDQQQSYEILQIQNVNCCFCFPEKSREGNFMQVYHD